MVKKIINYLNKPITKKTYFKNFGIFLLILFSILNYVLINKAQTQEDWNEIKICLFPECLMFIYCIFAYITSPSNK